MRRPRRALIFGLAAIPTVTLAAAALFLYIVDTGWFQSRVRNYLASTLEQATGARVEIGQSHFDWHTLSLASYGLVIHGTEAASDAPLVNCPSVRIGFNILSLFGKSVRLNSVVVDQPKVGLLIRPDGSTNLPALSLRRLRAHELFDLRITRYVLKAGVLRINDQRHLFDVRGEDLKANAQANPSRNSYVLDLSARRLTLETAWSKRVVVAVALHANLGRDRLTLEQAQVAWGDSNISANGEISHFNSPRVNVRFSTFATAADLSQIALLGPGLGGGFRATGTAHFYVGRGLSLTGQVQGSQLVYRRQGRADIDLHASSDFSGSSDKLLLRNLTIRAMGGAFKGQGSLQRLGRWECEGVLRGFSLPAVARFYSPERSFVFSGSLGGTIAVEGSFGRPSSDLLVRSSLQIDPAKGRMPVSGQIALTAHSNSGVYFGDSHLDLPRTHIAFSGSPDGVLHLALDSKDPTEIKKLLPANSNLNALTALNVLSDGNAHFAGTITALRKNAIADGVLSLSHFEWREQTWNVFESSGRFSCDAASMSSFRLESDSIQASGNATVALSRCQISPDSQFRIHAEIGRLDLAAISAQVSHSKLRVGRGFAAATIDAYGTGAKPQGSGTFTLKNVLVSGEAIDRVAGDFSFSKDDIEIKNGRLSRAPQETAIFAASYQPQPNSWRNGRLALTVDSKRLAISDSEGVNGTFFSRWKADLEVHAQLGVQFEHGSVRPLAADGRISVRNFQLDGQALGQLNGRVSTNGDGIALALNGDLRDSQIAGEVNVSLPPATTVRGSLSFPRLSVQTLAALLLPRKGSQLPFSGSLSGRMELEGLLDEMSKFRTAVTIDKVALRPVLPARDLPLDDASILAVHNTRPVRFETTGEKVTIHSFEMAGRDTSLKATGLFGLSPGQPLAVNLDGFVNLKLIRLLDPAMDAAGSSSAKIAIAGTVAAPSLTGKLELKNAAFSSRNFSNVLNSVNGTISFNNDRATLEQVTAETGGGHLRLGGFVAFRGADALAYRLEGHAENVRVRYARNLSTTFNADLRLTGASASSLLSGSATVSRIVLDPNADFGGVLAGFADWGATPANREGFLSGLHMDVGIESAPNLQLSTQLSRDVEAEMSLRLRGTPAQPILQGGASINQGDIRVFGTRYSINRGDIRFVNTSKVEPVLDLDLQTQARGIDIDITISGTINKLNVNYRSDPPLQPRDIVALLTVGRTPEAASNVQSVQATTSDTSALQSGVHTVLGQAISPAPSRLSKLFGITNIKIDPLVQGITNTPQSRLTLEHQISRAITITYITNLEQTSEQIFRLEWAFNRQYSVVAIRDDNGEFGIDIQYKKRFK